MNFSFGAPWFLLLLLLIPCFIWCKVHTKHFYFTKIAWVRTQIPLFSLLLWLKITIFALMVVALAEPYIYDPTSNSTKRGRDLALVLDASGSMAQSGFHTKNRFKNRYEVSIDLAKDFVKKRLDDNIAVVVFGTFAYTASPLTYDLSGVSYLLDMTNVGVAGESTAIGDALMQAMHTLSFGDAENKVIVLLTDGQHNAGSTSPRQAVEKAKKTGIKIYTIGIGQKNEYDAVLLETVSKETGAKSYSAIDADELAKVYEQIESLEPSPIRSENYLDRNSLAFYPLIFATLLLLGWVLSKHGIFTPWTSREAI
ncbi:VWA domain-containing protein [Sulfurovum sp. zt1-1]|uniref:VWA domain-containing protein n=1 Tax=Sulfurovum zhangzhouensis TaxID=3019067 RepID=A0ABT7QUY3_9BACT|nr:VWA domain-containing protein [Sulfurovum zhangzhouensis]MDM5270649.1 VWA domain-containing protein [Sulfurovum zhangzhouensis]